MTNPLVKLYAHGQSAWLDNIHRELIHDGELGKLISQDALKGITSNPSIFQKAITKGNSYQDSIRSLMQKNPDYDERTLFFDLAIEDIQNAASLLKPVYKESGYRDGYVSIEVSPDLAYDPQGTIKEARYLFKKINRKNVMIKVPATLEGLEAIEELTAEGISVNATLLFSVKRYNQVAEAYIRGLEKRVANGGDLTQVASVASFFISRVDVLVDKLLEEKLSTADEDMKKIISNIKGTVAIANAKIAYGDYEDLFNSKRFEALKQNGAQSQRLLWASTGVKNPNYSDVLYIEKLIGRDTVNTMPPATMDAFRDHGEVSLSLSENLPQALQSVAILPTLGLDLDSITAELEKDGVRLFIESFDDLLASIKESMMNIQNQASGQD